MKLHLLRLARAQKEVRFPGLAAFWARRLEAAEEAMKGRLYLLLEGELVIDLPDGGYLHLRPSEAAHLEGPHRLVPVGPCVVAAWEK
ncbi:hypothetical protein DV704_04250 [Meiothermus sp. QL-1]|uniref:hypothetical protein n=1 Tax=Meiothermus sp. QL-1 TaxID=2058095 RepID=UPI000E0C181E|nr:hypothetical protein [Meiothermus sp. QL-1]RDI96133.1 hypothetical protein DV704_04250 [Meiothermus sp. QL-1]